jgi:hypothetical protein
LLFIYLVVVMLRIYLHTIRWHTHRHLSIPRMSKVRWFLRFGVF